MRVLINCSNIKVGGGVQVAHSFIHELPKFDGEFIVVVSSELKKQIEKNVLASFLATYEYDIKASPAKCFFANDYFLDNLVKKYSVEKVFTIFGPAYWKPQVPHICGYAKPHYVYTNSPFFQKISLKDRFFLKIKEFFHLHDFKYNSDVLITENLDVSNKIGKKLKKNTFTVSNNYNQIFDNPDEWEDITLPSFDGIYLLTISANYPHKNLDVIPKVINELEKRGIKKFKFVVTLEKNALSSDDRINSHIVYLGKINIKKCPPLYKQSKYMFLPTLLECFSASYAEAMRMEKLILTSDLDFAKGICRDSAIYFDPLNANDIVEKLLEIEDNNKKYNEMVGSGKLILENFCTSHQRAKKYLDIIQETN